MPSSGQNIGSKGLGGKILLNKELGQAGLAACVPNSSELGARFDCALSTASVKVVRHMRRIFSSVQSCGKPPRVLRQRPKMVDITLRGTRVRRRESRKVIAHGQQPVSVTTRQMSAKAFTLKPLNDRYRDLATVKNDSCAFAVCSMALKAQFSWTGTRGRAFSASVPTGYFCQFRIY